MNSQTKRKYFKLEKRLKAFVFVLLMALISFLVLVPQLLHGGGSTLMGSDTFFHLSRYTDAAMQIKTGYFSYFQQFFTYAQSGRIINALYGPAIAYLEGLLLLLVHFSGLLWANLSNFILNFIAMSTMAYLLKENKVPMFANLLLSSLFIITGNVSVQATSGTYAFGYAFLPLLICAAVRLVKDKENPVKVWEVVLAFSLLAQSHVLSMIMGMFLYFFALLTFFLLSIKDKKILFSTIKKLAISILFILIFNANILFGCLDVFQSNTLFSPFRPASLLILPTISNGLSDPVRFSTSLFFITQFAMIYLFFKKYREPWFWFASVIFEVLSAVAIGWLSLSWVPEITLFQFSFRFMALALPMGLFLIGNVFVEFSKKKQHFTAYVFIFISIIFTFIPYMNETVAHAVSFNGLSHSKVVVRGMFAKDYAQLMRSPQKLISFNYAKIMPNQAISITDYLPRDTAFQISPTGVKKTKPLDEFTNEAVSDLFKSLQFNGKELQKTVTSNGLLCTWYSSKTGITGLPVVAYAHSKITLNGQLLASAKLEHSAIGSIRVEAKKGENRLLINYQPHKLFKYAIVFQVVAFLVLFFWAFKKLLIKLYLSFF